MRHDTRQEIAYPRRVVVRRSELAAQAKENTNG